MNKPLYLLVFILFFSINKAGTQNNLFFSEYVEGSGNNKCLELYNPTTAAINLNAYTIEIYNNGSANPAGTPWALSGTIPSMRTFVLCSGLADGALQSIEDGHFGFGSFNGDDAIALKHNGRTIDVFGAIGCDPGDAWTEGGLSTKDVTLVRKSCILSGNSGSGCNFSALSKEWIGFPQNDFSHLGSHDSGVPIVEIQGASALCSNPSIRLSVETGYSSYKWSTGSATNSITVTRAGNYSVTISTSEGCSAMATKVINGASPAINAEISNIKEPSCKPKKDGSFRINASGGVGGFSYDWGEGAQTSSAVREIGAGNYVITITDRNGCTETVTAIINAPVLLPLNPPIVTNETCKDRKDGTITLAASGAQGKLEFSIDGGINTQEEGYFDNLAPGNYLAQVIDASGCGDQKLVTIEKGSQFTLGNTRVAQEKCAGEGGGQILLSPSGGEAPYSYSLNGSPFSSNPVLSNLMAGKHEIVVRDANNCAKTFEQVIEAGSDLMVTFEAEPVTCAGKMDGIIHIATTGGVGAVSYYIDDDNRPYFRKTEFANLAAGLHKIRVRDQKDCVVEEEIFIGQEATFDVRINVQPEVCAGNENGQINIVPNDENTTYEFSLDGQSFQKENIFDHLTPNLYEVFTRDGTGCIVTDTARIDSGSNLIITFIDAQPESCPGREDGQFQIFTKGEIGQVNYALDGENFGESSVFSGLAAGQYIIYGKDERNCTVQETATIFAGELPQIQSVNTTNLSCNGENNGQITIEVIGQNAPFQYRLNMDDFQTTNTFSGLGQGDYTVTVRDANGCEISADTSISEPLSLEITCEILQHLSSPNAMDGAARVTVSGGSVPYNIQLVDANFNNIISIDGIEEFDQLSSGEYTVEVIDDEGCKATCTFLIEEPPCNIIVDPSIIDVQCKGNQNGSIHLIIENAVEPLSFDWGREELDGQQNPSGLPAGIYEVTVTDQENCSKPATIVVQEPPPLEVKITELDSAICEKDSTILTLNANYDQYLWSTGAATSEIIVYEAGSYSVMVSNAMGCVVADTIEISKILQDTIYKVVYTCDINQVGLELVEQRGEDGCVDILLTTVELARKDTTFIEASTCSPELMGVSSIALSNQFDCDSLIITNTQLLPSDTTALTEIVCDVTQTGTFQTVLINQFNCDSLIILDKIIDPANETVLKQMDCNRANLGRDTSIYPNRFNCDSLVIIETALDTAAVITFLSRASCELALTGIDTLFFKNNQHCDSLVVITTTLDSSSIAFLEKHSCDSVDTGIDTLFFTNQFLCDSLVIITTHLLKSHFLLVEETSCNPQDTGTFVLNLVNQFDCDSVVQINIKATSISDCQIAFSALADTLCGQEANGSIEIITTLGMPPYHYFILDENQLDTFEKGIILSNNEVHIASSLPAGNYIITLVDDMGIEESKMVSISVFSPKLDLGTEISINLGDSLTLKPIANFEINRYEWTTSRPIDCPNCPEIDVKPLTNERYELTAYAANGCSASAALLIRVKKEAAIYIPTAFSPNSDQLNDHFQIYPSRAVRLIKSFQIVDYEGRLMYQVKNIVPSNMPEGWDGFFNGQPMTPAVFVVFVEAVLIDGTEEQLVKTMNLVR